jgi:REP element-mobilizing transposase RayT
MARMAGRNVQTELAFVVPATHGGARKNAGRKPRGRRAGECHRRRPPVDPRRPLHIALRVVGAVGRLRRPHAYRALRHATWIAGRRDDFRIVQISIQQDHIHLICEAEDRVALSRGMQGFKISAARRLNAEVARERGAPAPRRGTVFTDRYHVEVICSPTQARNCLAYVMNNWRKHGADHGSPFKRDPYSSSIVFRAWREDPGGCIHLPPGYHPLPVRRPQSWLLADGYRRGGPPISWFERPGSRRQP